jgi:hypothetical protein
VGGIIFFFTPSSLTACGVICVCGHKHQMLCGGPSCGLFAETAFFPSFQSVQRVMIGAIYSEDERENGQSHKKSERPNYSLSLARPRGVLRMREILCGGAFARCASSPCEEIRTARMSPHKSKYAKSCCPRRERRSSVVIT